MKPPPAPLVVEPVAPVSPQPAPVNLDMARAVARMIGRDLAREKAKERGL